MRSSLVDSTAQEQLGRKGVYRWVGEASHKSRGKAGELPVRAVAVPTRVVISPCSARSEADSKGGAREQHAP